MAATMSHSFHGEMPIYQDQESHFPTPFSTTFFPSAGAQSYQYSNYRHSMSAPVSQFPAPHLSIPQQKLPHFDVSPTNTTFPQQGFWPNPSVPSELSQSYYTSLPVQPIQHPTPVGLTVGPAPVRSYTHDGNTHDGINGLGLSFDNDKHSRAQSFASIGSSNATVRTSCSDSHSDLSRASSPTSTDLTAYGYLNTSGTWTCNYPGCQSKAVFTRGCDLRKHHKRHTKTFFCSQAGCTQQNSGGFSSKKDLARHEAKHNPGVPCEWDGCKRIFSRVDNMRDHVKRIHLRKSSRRSSRI